MKRKSIWKIGFQSRLKNIRQVESLFKEINTENTPILGKNANIQVL
jgi:hypothetical protein